MIAFILESFQKRQQKDKKADPLLKRIRKIITKHALLTCTQNCLQGLVAHLSAVVPMHRYETETGGTYSWTTEEIRDPYQILRRLLLDEILQEDETYAWLHYVEEQHEAGHKIRSQKKPKRKATHVVFSDDSESEPEHTRDSGKPPSIQSLQETSTRSFTPRSGAYQSICRGGTIYAGAASNAQARPVSAFASWDQPALGSINAPPDDDVESTHRRKERGPLGMTEIGSKIKHAWTRQWHGKGTGRRFYIPRITRDASTNVVRVVWEDEEEEYDEHRRLEHMQRLRRQQEAQRQERWEDAYRPS